MKKNFLIGLLALVMCFALVGCGKTNNNSNENNYDNNPQQTTNINDDTINTNDETANNQYEYNYFDGKLTQIVDEEGNPKQNDFVIDGIILVGNRHGYEGISADGEGIIEALVNNGYKKEGINKDFYLNEYIQFYLDTQYSESNDDVKIIVTPHKPVEELEKMSLPELEELAVNNGGFVLDYNTPDAENHMYIGEGYVNMDYPEGEYDILFTYKGNLAYFININETKEPME